MSLKWKEIAALINESREILSGSIIQKIFQVEGLANNQSLILQGFHQNTGPWRLWISLMKEKAYWVLVPDSFELKATKKPSDFVMTLRKFLIGKKLDKLEQIEGERILLMQIEDQHTLVVELIPKSPNLVLLREWEE
ncbi:MAG: NFACT family protein, partial [Oligoflexia bacterium]|nr:NFACT family protein [Oligoflexia bacterium]